MIENILSRLEKVKGRNGAYTACCPAHSDKSPSLAIRELDDGRILLKCFADCSVQDIMGAIGMEIGDLFPDTKKDLPPVKRKYYASDLLRVIEFEAWVVSVAAHTMSTGKKLSDTDRDRMKVATARIMEAVKYVG
jgi:2C-methyl-D-erythritol 2,4-cyclodiphosphate synthase